MNHAVFDLEMSLYSCFHADAADMHHSAKVFESTLKTRRKYQTEAEKKTKDAERATTAMMRVVHLSEREEIDPYASDACGFDSYTAAVAQSVMDAADEAVCVWVADADRALVGEAATVRMPYVDNWSLPAEHDCDLCHHRHNNYHPEKDKHVWMIHSG